MSGVKNRSGGAREGAGRPPKKLGALGEKDPKKFLLQVMNDPDADARSRLEAAKALLPYLHVKKGDGGKKEEQQAAADKAKRGRYKPPEPPKLVVNNG